MALVNVTLFDVAASSMEEGIVTKQIDLTKMVRDSACSNVSKGNLVLFLLILCVPLLFIGYGLYNAYNYWDLQRNGILSTAEVVRIEEERSHSSSEPNFFPVVKFEGQNGGVHEYRAGRAKKGAYKVGQKARVYYDVEKPERVVLKGLIDHGMRAFLIVLSLGFIALIFIFKTIRQER